jgi:HPt (histidine-containing phosphotransfer) domain-containing protein
MPTSQDDPPIDISILTSLEDSIGTENLYQLISLYLDHSTKAIAKMKIAFEQQNFVTIEAENHALKGGSGTFGAMQLYHSCQALQVLAKKLIKNNQASPEEIEQVQILLTAIDDQYQYVYQTYSAFI